MNIFNDIHSQIRTEIEKANFKYVRANDWFNLELGIFPTSLTNFGFNVLPFESEDSEYEGAEELRINWRIQFVLDARQDDYLQRLNEVIETVRLLEDIDSDEIIYLKINWHKFHQTNMGEHTILTFDSIITEVRVQLRTGDGKIGISRIGDE